MVNLSEIIKHSIYKDISIYKDNSELRRTYRHITADNNRQ